MSPATITRAATRRAAEAMLFGYLAVGDPCACAGCGSLSVSQMPASWEGGGRAIGYAVCRACSARLAAGDDDLEVAVETRITSPDAEVLPPLDGGL